MYKQMHKAYVKYIGDHTALRKGRMEKEIEIQHVGKNNKGKRTTIMTNLPADPANPAKSDSYPPSVSEERGNRGRNRRSWRLDLVHDEA